MLPRRRFLTITLALSAWPVVHPAAADVDVAELFEPYGRLLEGYLVEKDLPGGGLVSAYRYREALDDPVTGGLLAQQRARLRTFDPALLDTGDAAIAFWLNAYNFFMLAHILENPRRGQLVSSVRDYGSLFNPYRVFRRSLFDIGGRDYSLDEMQKEILLGEDYVERGWFDARVHFAVNCASVGCPPLRTALYRADNVERLLEENTRRALLTPRHMQFVGDTLYLSQLFEWYEDDYVHHSGSVGEFLKEHTPPPLHPRIDAASSIRYIDYDWSLNEPDNFSEFR